MLGYGRRLSFVTAPRRCSLFCLVPLEFGLNWKDRSFFQLEERQDWKQRPRAQRSNVGGRGARESWPLSRIEAVGHTQQQKQEVAGASPLNSSVILRLRPCKLASRLFVPTASFFVSAQWSVIKRVCGVGTSGGFDC